MSTAVQDRLQRALGDAYQIERELAPGGMSCLFLATERSLDRKVVVKLLPPELASEVSAQRFQREMLVTAKLQHSHILPVLTAGARDGLLYYVTPYVAGESLRLRLTQHGALAIQETIRLLCAVADALAFAHTLGVVHRDLKPDNIFLQHRHPILADFGIASAVEQSTRSDPAERLTATGMGLGTLGYMAPEQLAGERDVDARADIYAMGVVAYEMLAGHPPFAELPTSRLIVAHMTQPPEPVTTYRPAAPAPLAALVMRCLEKDPADRWQSVDELVPSLDELAVSMGAPPAQRETAQRRAAVAAAPSTPSAGSALDAGLRAFGRSDWRAAFESLSAADANGTLAPAHLEKLAESAWWIGKIDECIRTRERAYAQYVERGDLAKAARVALAVAEDCFHKLARSVAQGWMQRAERNLDGLPECIAHGWLARERAILALEERDFDRAWVMAQQAYEIARRLQDMDLQTLALQDRGRILVSRGRVAEGMAAIDEATAAAASGQLGTRTSGRIFCNMLSTCSNLADYRRAGEWNEAAQRWCEPHAESAYPGICRVHRAQLLRLRGSWPEAEVEARHASAELEGFLSDVAGEANYELGEIKRQLGDLDAAERLFRQAHELGRDPVPGLALLRLAQGKAGSARSLLERALSEQSLSPLDRAKLLPAQAQAAFALGDWDATRAAARELASIAETYGAPALAARAAFAQGLAELGEGQAAIAAASLRRAWKLSKESDLPYEAAHSRVLLGRAYRACGDREDAELELRAAAAIFERLGAAEDARSAMALLES